ncbi:MAG: hypothetical protein JWM77_716 [Rhodospirillales bacterium]|jgi:hypothetical protein|nr:hypothetical protein [Rhodospirillales bacterium]
MPDTKHPRQIPTAPDPSLFADSPAPQDMALNIRTTGSPRPPALDKQSGTDRKGPS